jgi:hypothetical protein
MQKLAPSGHRPTNAHLDISPFHFARDFADPADISPPTYPILSQIDKRSGLTGDTYPAGYWKSTLEDDKALLSLQFQGRNFARLAKDSPISYETLKEQGMLNKDRMPTKKYRLQQLLGDNFH